MLTVLNFPSFETVLFNILAAVFVNNWTLGDNTLVKHLIDMSLSVFFLFFHYSSTSACLCFLVWLLYMFRCFFFSIM